MIIISHFIQTFAETNDISSSTNSLQIFLLALFQHFGNIGNNIFFICSAWFLLDAQKSNKKKLFQLLINVWVISFIILIIFILAGNVRLRTNEIIKCLLPTTFSNNWYITCYILFSLLFPILNYVLDKLTQKELLSLLLVSGFLNYVVHPLFKEWGGGYFYFNQLIVWTLLYMLLGYYKRYILTKGEKRNNDSVRFGLVLFSVSIVGYIGLPLMANFLGSRNAFFNHRLLFFNSTDNVFLVLLPLSLFSLFSRLHLQNKIINRISSFSLYIYIIHENLLVRRYFRPLIYSWLNNTYGYGNVLGWIFLFAFITFVVCSLLSLLYQKTILCYVKKVTDWSFPRICTYWNRTLERLVNIYR